MAYRSLVPTKQRRASLENLSTDRHHQAVLPERGLLVLSVVRQRTFQTKPELAWQLIQRARTNRLPFVAVAMDDLYGRNPQLCRRLAKAGIEYYGDIPANTVVYLGPPRFETRLTKRGKPAKNKQLVAQHRAEVRNLLHHPAVTWARLTADWGRYRVWLVEGERCYQRWLLIRQEAKQVTYSLSNAPVKTSLETMAWRKSH